MRNGKQAKMGQRSPKAMKWAEGAQRKELSKQGLVEKSINPESKGYGNLGRESLKELAKAHGNEKIKWDKGTRKR